jgi:hypothetical protein
VLASPVFLLGSTLATAWAALFHVILGRKWSELILYWFLALVGFAVGQAMADVMGFRWMMIGQVHFLEGTLACWVAMLVARWVKV